MRPLLPIVTNQYDSYVLAMRLFLPVYGSVDGGLVDVVGSRLALNTSHVGEFHLLETTLSDLGRLCLVEAVTSTTHRADNLRVVLELRALV